jgi:hypothetical protein
MVTTCSCSCHLSTGTHRDCNIDAGFGTGCGPHESAGGCERCGLPDGQSHVHLDDDCQLPHSHTKRRHPPRARVGFCCEGCVERWDETLQEVTDLYAGLASVIPLGSVVDDTAEHKHTKRDGSPAMFRLDAWAMMRNELNPIVTDSRNDAPRHTWLNGLPDVPTLLTNWAEAIWDACQWGDDWPVTVTGAAAAIRANRTVIAAMPDVDTFDAELRWIHQALRRVHGINDPTPLFRCISVDCGGNVWRMDTGAPRCDRCSRRYDRLDIVRARGAGLHERRHLRSERTGNGHA